MVLARITSGCHREMCGGSWRHAFTRGTGRRAHNHRMLVTCGQKIRALESAALEAQARYEK